MYKIKHSSLGFTLMELLVTLSIIGIVLALSAPNLQSMITNGELTSQVNTIVGALNIARSESVKRNNEVVVRKTSTAWKDGWEVFVDTDTDHIKDAGEEVIQQYEALTNNYFINTSFTNYIAYRPDGRSNSFGSFYVCSSLEKKFKRVVISASGRIRTESWDDASPEDYDGDDGVCA